MSNSIYYKRITGSNIQGDATTVTEPQGTLVVTNNGDLRLHDGTTQGGVAVSGSGGGFATTSTLVNGTYTVALSTTGQLNLPSAANTGSDNARIQSANSIDILANLAKWTFSTNSNLTVPGTIVGNSGALDLNYDGSVVLSGIPSVDAVIQTTNNNSSNTSTWTFGTNGGLTLPLGGYITAPSAMGSNTVIQAPVSNRALLQNSDGTNLVAADDQGVAMTTVRGTVQFGYNLEAPGVPTHFHINKLNQSFDLFFGDDSNYFHLPAGGGSPVIGANDGSSGQKLWTFGQDGSLTLPQSNSGAAVISAGTVGLEFTSNGHAFQFNTDGTLIFPDLTVQTTAWTGTVAYSNVSGTPNLSVYATQSTVSTLQITVNNLTNTVSTLTTTATVNALIANSLTNYATQSYVTTQGYTTTATVNALIANSLTNVVKTIVAGTGTAVSVSGNTVTIWTTASGGIANLNNLSSDISFSTAGVGAPTFNTTSTGVKISYYPSESATMVDYATGIDAGVLWNSIPGATSNFAFKWYGGTSTVATLNGLGTLTATKFVGDGSSLTNVTVNVAGSILGTGTNVTLVAGSYSYLFDNTGTFTMPANGDIVMTGTNATITAGGSITAGYNSPSGGTAFIAGNAAVNNIALGYQPTSGAANMAIRDLSTVSTYMYFDAASNTTSTASQFVFRSSSAYTTWAKIDQYGVNQPTRPAFRVYGAGTTTALSTTQNTNGILNSNNWAVDFQQGTALSASTGLFTAPVAGLYQVNFTCRTNANNNNAFEQVQVRKNTGGTITSIICLEWPVNAGMNHTGGSTIVKLAVGDTLYVQVTGGTVNFDGNDNWSVAYIG
jgi:hypothetical protein